MATSEQLKALIRSHFNDDLEHFITVSLQLAAHEAHQGHGALAHDIRLIVEKARQERNVFKVFQFPSDLRGLVLSDEPKFSFASLVVSKEIKSRIDRIIHEYRQQDKLKSHGLSNRRKILIAGPPGTGKTMTSQVLAHELGLTLHTIQVDKLVTKFMGETAAKLRQIFDLIQKEKAVYLFDEFDAIGGDRDSDSDVGEMRRVLNSFLQFIERDTSDSLIVAATNNPKLLDKALYRRFHDVLYYDYPDSQARKNVIQNVLGTFVPKKVYWKRLLTESEGLSHAEIDQACRDSIKQSVLSDQKIVSSELLSQMLFERQSTHNRGQE